MFLLALFACLCVALMLSAIARSVTYNTKTDVTRTYTGEGIPANSGYVVNGLDMLTTLNGSTTPACSLDCCITLALSSGAATLDLTNITDPTLGTVDAVGLTPYVARFQNPSSNANPITFKFGATNGYTGWGAAFEVTLQTGEEICFLKQVAANIASGSKTIDFTGSGTQAINIQMAFG